MGEIQREHVRENVRVRERHAHNSSIERKIQKEREFERGKRTEGETTERKMERDRQTVREHERDDEEKEREREKPIKRNIQEGQRETMQDAEKRVLAMRERVASGQAVLPKNWAPKTATEVNRWWKGKVDSKWMWDEEYFDLPSGLRDLQFQCYDEYDKELRRERKRKKKEAKKQRRLARELGTPSRTTRSRARRMSE